jgi:general secretion pathway protein H
MTPFLRAINKPRCGGFTLIELLVVLSILALVAIGASSTLSESVPSLRLKSATRIMADDLRATRRAALLRHHALELQLLPGAYASNDGIRHQSLPAGTRLSLAAPVGASATEPDRIRFFADGSSTGGRIELRLGERHSAILIDWLTGRVRVDE